MTALVAILWTIYLSECFVRVKPGDWVFRRGAAGGFRGVREPDVPLLNGRLEFSWTALLPWSAAYLVSGGEFQATAPAERLTRIKAERRLPVAGAMSLFVLVLLVFPALVLTNTLAPALPYLVVALALAWLATFTAFMTSYRRLHGRRPAVEVWLAQALSPLSLIRAPFVLSLHALADAHPVAAAAALCDDEEFLRIARMWHYDAEDARARIERLASARRLRPALTNPPAAPEAGATLYCPRCHATYLQARTECRDCSDVPLSPLPVSTSSA